MKRDKTACVGCTAGANCYTAGTSCLFTEADCYVRGNTCLTGTAQCKDGGVCSSLTDFCGSLPCNVAKVKGEWAANHLFGSGGLSNPTERGRIDMPLPKGPGEGSELCVKLPWKRIVESSYSDSFLVPPIGAKFNKTLAEDPANVKWQLATYYDVSDLDDFIKGTPCLAITDVVPNLGTNPGDAANGTDGCECYGYQSRVGKCLEYKAQGRELSFTTCQSKLNSSACTTAGCIWDAGKSKCYNDFCYNDVNFDGKVGAPDFSTEKWEYGRSGCPCKTK
jgi:hypothetical protein